MARYGKALIVGIGGAIGSGKSVVRDAFGVLGGWETVDCDTEAKALYFDPLVREKIKTLLHLDPLTDGRLDTRLLRSLLAEPGKGEVLEQIIHGALFDFLRQKSLETNGEVLLVESAILFSSGLAGLCDRTIAVIAPQEVRAERSGKRDIGKGADFFRGMEKRQELERKLLSDADYEVSNFGRHSVILQTEQIIKQILKYDRR